MLLGIVFLTGLCCISWILFGKDFYINLKTKKGSNEVELKEGEIVK